MSSESRVVQGRAGKERSFQRWAEENPLAVLAGVFVLLFLVTSAIQPGFFLGERRSQHVVGRPPHVGIRDGGAKR